MLVCFRISPSPSSSLYKLHEKTPIHLFNSRNQVISLWIEIKLFFRIHTINNFVSPVATFGLVKGNNKSYSIQARATTDFKSLQVNRWEINPVTSKSQITCSETILISLHKFHPKNECFC